jgi:hypothetical protein
MFRIRFALLATLVACTAKEKASDAMPEAAAAAVAAAAFPLADVTGKWMYVAKTLTGDTVLVTGELNATADSTGWTMTLPGRPPLPMTVTVSGDSVMTTVAPYESVLRKGVQVTTEGTMRMSGGKMIGTLTAHYNVKAADSVRMMITEATRKP